MVSRPCIPEGGRSLVASTPSKQKEGVQTSQMTRSRHTHSCCRQLGTSPSRRSIEQWPHVLRTPKTPMTTCSSNCKRWHKACQLWTVEASTPESNGFPAAAANICVVACPWSDDRAVMGFSAAAANICWPFPGELPGPVSLVCVFLEAERHLVWMLNVNLRMCRFHSSSHCAYRAHRETRSTQEYIPTGGSRWPASQCKNSMPTWWTSSRKLSPPRNMKRMHKILREDGDSLMRVTSFEILRPLGYAPVVACDLGVWRSHRFCGARRDMRHLENMQVGFHPC